ncbi:hypothetical protein D6783_03625 [Candidatus Woesearchaeota archaeon]|nr:MAG: hypothetical protein D6783_03625 [Candidatus Woesearchaeota archaeon]
MTRTQATKEKTSADALTLAQHKTIFPIIVLVVLFLGIALGFRISAVSEEPSLLAILNFGVTFLNTIVIIILFSLLVRTRDDLKSIQGSHNKRKP